MILRVVFDTNILYSAIRQPKGLPAKAVDLVVAGQVIPCVSDEVLEEYRDVLLREELDLHDRRAGAGCWKCFPTCPSASLPPHPWKSPKTRTTTASTNARMPLWPTTSSPVTPGTSQPYKATKIISARQLVELIERQK